MAILSNVIIVGATSSIGIPVLTALLSNPSFSVTILARPNSGILNNPPSGAKIAIAPSDDHSALVSAMKGADALVITISVTALDQQSMFINAAAEAGVKRIIPSEFGADLDNPKTAALSGFAVKLEVRKQLELLADEGRITWSAVSNGAFLDWSLKAGLIGFNIKENKATLFDGGDRPFSATLLSDVAKAVVGILKHPDETKNRLVYVHSARLTQKQLVAAYDKIRGTKLETTVVDAEEVAKAGTEKFAKGDFSGFVDQFLIVGPSEARWRSGAGTAVDAPLPGQFYLEISCPNSHPAGVPFAGFFDHHPARCGSQNPPCWFRAPEV
ncbi:NAD(P)-binding protein [Wilcoxina mikolae CBS 423.85]|nr:NAD(P)-binding protein [Wilcoxina mikolae CBS 423.85]